MEWLAKARSSEAVHLGQSMVGRLSIWVGIAMARNDTHINGHVIPQVLVPRNKSVAILVFEAHAARRPFIDTVEIFNGRDDRVRGIMREDLYSHRDPRSNL